MGLFSRSNSTVANTTSNQYDQRQVYDAGGGIVGEGNTIDRSSNFLYATSDSSQRSYDLSDHSITTSTDGGAFDVISRFADGIGDIGRMQTSAAEKIALSAGSSGNSAFSLAERAQADAAGFNSSALSKVFDQAQRSSAQAYESSSDALGFAKGTFSDIVGLAKSVVGQAGEQASAAASTASGAYQSAADTSTGNKTLIYAGMAVLAIAAVAFAFKR